jgi:HEAT repeat protein
MSIEVLIAHADGEEELAEKLADPLRQAGYDVTHRGTMMVGESFTEEASKILSTGGPVVLCGTVRSLGTGWAHRLVNVARQTSGVRVFAVQMEQGAYVEQLSLDGTVARYWQDKQQAERDLILALKKYYPPHLTAQALSVAHDAEQRYRELALASCDIIDLANLPENDRHVATRQLELRRLYVPLRVRVEIACGAETETTHLEAIEKKQRRLRGPFSSLSGTTFDAEGESSPRVAIGYRLALAKRIVVLGDAGAGKTTLIRWLATAYLLRLKDDVDLREMPDVATLPYNDWLPIIIRCRDLDQSALTGSLETLLRCALTKAELKEAEVTALRTGIIEKLSHGQAMLLLDGLDEITDVSLRSKFCQQIGNIQLAYPNAPIVVTSRIVGYREMGDRLDRGFEHVTVADLTKEDKDNFVHRWCSLTERAERRAEAAGELIHDIHSTDRIERLTSNPMLLTTMALVKRKVGRLPSRRADLYWDALEVLLNWRREVDQPIDHREAVPQLEYVAYSMCERGIQQIREDEIISLLEQMRSEYGQIYALQKHAPEEFLEILERRTGILVRSGHVRHLGRPIPVFEFRHLTFQEYLAGLALVDGRFPNRDRSRSLAQNVSPLAGQVIESNPTRDPDTGIANSENWSEALRLCVATCNDDDVDEVLLAILHVTDDEDAQKTARPRAILAALALADEPNASENVALEILGSFVKQITANDGSQPDRTGLDAAIEELSTSRWTLALEELLIAEFVSQSGQLRIAIGSLCGIITAASAPSSDEGFLEWISSRASLLLSEDQNVATAAALAIVSIARRRKIGVLPDIAESLMQMLNKTTVMAHAASWALSALSAKWTNEQWLPNNGLSRIIELVGDAATETAILQNLIGILGRQGEHRSVPLLIERLDHADSAVQRAAAFALGRIGDAEAVDQLIVKLESGDAGVRYAAARALGEIQDLKAVEPLLALASDEDELVRVGVLNAVSEFQDERVPLLLIDRLHDSDDLVRASAAINLGRRRDSAAVEALIESLQDESSFVQNISADALGKIGDPRAERELISKITHQDHTVRAAAITALGYFSSPVALQSLVGGLKDEAREVKNAAEYSLMDKAMRQFNDGDMSGSIEIFRQMVQTLEDDDYKNNLAYCLILNGQYEDAASQFELIDLSFSMNAPLYRHNRAVLFFLAGDGAKGTQQIQEALSMMRLNPEYDTRSVACMLVLSVGNVRSVPGIPIDAAALINLFMMGGITRDEMLTEIFQRYPFEGEQWTVLTEPGEATD